MKILFGWICDPCIHLFLIGLLLVRLAMTVGGDPEVLDREIQTPRCHGCGSFQDEHPTCPALSATNSSLSAAEMGKLTGESAGQ